MSRPSPARSRRGTRTSDFGVGRRENHDASDFYARFHTPHISNDATVGRTAVGLDELVCGDARDLTGLAPQLQPASVALVVTSPPYYAGKEYETALGEGHIPGSYKEYLRMLHDVFAACVEVLEPGGRIAVNVANLGRKPYRSLSADVIGILQDDLKLLVRGEIIWRKSAGASGNCAWGSFQSASNPVLRDLTERVIVASKGRFDRALPRSVREKRDLPHDDTIMKEDFLSWTTDVWDIPPESASRVDHPAPFPVELPQRLIELYTYRDDLVLDPFMGSGSTAVAAVRTDRHFLGFDTDPAYVEIARGRVADARDERMRWEQDTDDHRPHLVPPAMPEGQTDDFPRRAVREGKMAKEVALQVLEQAGFTDIGKNVKVGSGVVIDFEARDHDRNVWYFDVSGAFSRGNDRAGLRRTDNVWRALGRASLLPDPDLPGTRRRLVLLTTDLPDRASSGGTALRTAREAGHIFDAVEMLSGAGQQRLARYAAEAPAEPLGELFPPRRRSRA